MSTKTFDQLSCLLYIKQCSTCSAGKPFQIGAPFCGKHWNEFFGLEPYYHGPSINCNGQSTWLGPYTSIAAGVEHGPATIIIPRRKIVTDLLNKASTNAIVSDRFQKAISGILYDKHNALYKRYIIEMLRNWLEKEVVLEIQDSSVKQMVEDRLKEWNDAILKSKIIKESAAEFKIALVIGEAAQAQQQSLNEFPPIVQYIAFHITPSIWQSPQGVDTFLPQAVASNVLFTEHGYISEKSLQHTEILLQAGVLSGGSYHDQYMVHRKNTTANEKQMTGLVAVEHRANLAYPKPKPTYENLASNMSIQSDMCL
jgi:hypothetical protein